MQAARKLAMNPYADPEDRQAAMQMIQMYSMPHYGYVKKEGTNDQYQVDQFNRPTGSMLPGGPIREAINPGQTVIGYDSEGQNPHPIAGWGVGGSGAAPNGGSYEGWKAGQEELGKRQAQQGSPSASDDLDFTQKLMDRQSYKEYSQALPTWNSFTQHIQSDDPAADKAIVDDFVKILNPGRAVTTGGFQLNLDTMSLPDQIKGEIMKAFEGAGHLSAAARVQMAQAAQQKMQAYGDAWKADSDQGRRVATAHGRGNDVDNLLPQLPTMAPLDMSSANTKTVMPTQPGQPAAQPPGASNGAALPPGVNPADALAQAKAAIAAGKSRAAVIQRLQQMGINPAGL